MTKRYGKLSTTSECLLKRDFFFHELKYLAHKRNFWVEYLSQRYPRGQTRASSSSQPQKPESLIINNDMLLNFMENCQQRTLDGFENANMFMHAKFGQYFEISIADNKY